MRSMAAGDSAGQPQAAVGGEALLGGEVVDVGLGGVERQPAGRRGGVDAAPARRRPAGPPDGHGHAGRGLVVGQGVEVDAGVGAGPRGGCRRAGDHLGLVEVGARRRRRRRTWTRTRRRPGAGCAARSGRRWRRPRTAVVPPLPSSDLVAVGQGEQLGQPVAEAADHEPHRGLAVAGAEVGRGGRRPGRPPPPAGPWRGRSRSGRRRAAGRRGWIGVDRWSVIAATLSRRSVNPHRPYGGKPSGPRGTDLPPRRRHRRVGHPGRRRQGQGAQGGRRGRDRLRRRRARLPDPRPHRRGGGGRLPATPRTTTTPRRPGLPELREAIAAKTARDSGLRRRAEPGPRHQRRQARRLQRLRHPARPGRRGAAARALLDHLPRADRPGRRRAGGRSPTDESTGFRVTRRPARGGPHRPDQGAGVRLAVEPDRRRLPARGGRGHRPLGRRAAGSGCSPTRSTSTSSTATHEFTSMPAVVPELADRCVVVNGVAKTYAMTGWRVGWMIGPPDVVKAATNLQSPRHLERGQRLPARPRSPPSPAASTTWPRCGTPSTGGGRKMHGAAAGHPGRHLPRAARAPSTPSRRFEAVLGRELARPAAGRPRSSWPT